MLRNTEPERVVYGVGDTFVGALMKQSLPVTSPVSRIQPCADPHAKVVSTYLLDSGFQPALHRGSETVGDRANNVHFLRDGGDNVLRTRRTLDIGRQEDPVLGFESSTEVPA